MNKCIYVIIDTSGSVNEMGKSHLLRNLCQYISELPCVNERFFSNIEFRFFQWNITMRELIVESDGNFPELKPQFTSDLLMLAEMLKNRVNSEGQTRAIILADGNFPTSDVEVFSKTINSSDDLITRVVAVGADANIRKLKKISSNNRAYLPENISAAILSTCVGGDGRVIGPETVSQIKTNQPSESQRDWNE